MPVQYQYCTIIVASCNKVLLKTGCTCATYKDTNIYDKIPMLHNNCSPADHRGTNVTNRYLVHVCTPGARGWKERFYKSDEMPPGSNWERNRGLNPSPLETQPGANFANFFKPKVRIWGFFRV